jgi:hypothetical protein
MSLLSAPRARELSGGQPLKLFGAIVSASVKPLCAGWPGTGVPKGT